MARDEIPELRALRDDYDRARRRLLDGIRKYLELGHKRSRIARSVDWSHPYVTKIGKGEVKE